MPGGPPNTTSHIHFQEFRSFSALLQEEVQTIRLVPPSKDNVILLAYIDTNHLVKNLIYFTLVVTFLRSPLLRYIM